jgi:N-methylhydantoinase A/oxoprolinase/acetone carboxylase beta subunit
VDVGGTNTDAVIMMGRAVLAAVKTPTTRDVTSGVLEALVGVLEQSAIAREAVAAVVIGTTHFTNAIIERRHLSPIAIVRLCLPATQDLPPMVDWPEDLSEAIGLQRSLAHGGNEFDGREISPLDGDELRRIGSAIAAKGIRAIAVSSVFSPVTNLMETEAAKILEGACPGARVVLSSQIGRLGLLERESAAILNASLLDLAERTVDAFAAALRSCGLTCRFFISQNDGTLMDGAEVRRYPC